MLQLAQEFVRLDVLGLASDWVVLGSVDRGLGLQRVLQVGLTIDPGSGVLSLPVSPCLTPTCCVTAAVSHKRLQV